MRRAEALAILSGHRAELEGQFEPGSDVDMCVVLDDGAPSGLAASHKRLDYVAASDFDVTIFQQLPLYIRGRVLKEGAGVVRS